MELIISCIYRCYLYLPLGAERERRATSADIRKHVTTQPGNQVNNFPGVRVLLVEDNKVRVIALKCMISSLCLCLAMKVNQKVGKRMLQGLGFDFQVHDGFLGCGY